MTAPARPAHPALAAFGEAREPDVWSALGRWRAAGRRFVMLTVIESLRIVISALGARPRTLGGLDAITAGQPAGEPLFESIAAVAYKQCRPLTNVPYDDEWRHEMVPVFVKRALREAFAGSGA